MGKILFLLFSIPAMASASKLTWVCLNGDYSMTIRVSIFDPVCEYSVCEFHTCMNPELIKAPKINELSSNVIEYKTPEPKDSLVVHYKDDGSLDYVEEKNDGFIIGLFNNCELQ